MLYAKGDGGGGGGVANLGHGVSRGLAMQKLGGGGGAPP